MALVTENFTGATAPLGVNWTQQRTTRTVTRNGGVGQQDAADASADVTAFWSADVFDDDHYSQDIIAGFGAGGARSNNLIIRASGSGDSVWNAYDFYTNGASGASNTELAVVVNGAATVLRSFATTFVATDVIKLTVVGTTLEVFKNGASIGTHVDSTISSGGAPGVGSYNDSGGTQPTFDDWEGGPLLGAPPDPVVRSRKLSTQQRMVA